MARLLLAVLAFGGLIAMCSAICSPCPSGYVYQATPNTACGYDCYTPLKMNCLPQPTYNAIRRIWVPPQPPTAIQLAAARPLLCGGSTYRSCPTIACAYSTSYAISGPLGCAVASSYISALALSQTTTNYTNVYKEQIQSYTAAMCAGGWSPAMLSQYASQAAEAVATAISATIAHYSTYVCTCCLGNSVAYTNVKANIQAVATAQASALAQAVSGIYDCDGNLLTYGSGIASALAMHIELAIDRVFAQAYSNSGFNCRASDLVTRVRTAIAQASVCVFAEAFAQAVDSSTSGVAYGCATTVAISAGGTTRTCRPITSCPCSPENYGYNNLGFEAGDFAAGSPVWDVTNTASPGATLLSSQVLNVQNTLVTLLPKEGSLFAGVPVGYGTNSISTTINVPPCATSVSASYVFKCNDLNSPYYDQGNVMITLTEVYTSAVYTNSVNAFCGMAGVPSTTNNEVTSDSSVANGGATNNGAWSTLSVNVTPGLYNMTVTASARNDLSNNNDPWKSWVYVDAVTFSP